MKQVLLGNEAIVKGALASGVNYVSGYPGCPSAEIGQGFLDLAKNGGLYAEWASNEKTALESAIGASFAGLKSLVNMKSFGINVCSDSLLPLAYTGTKAPMVIVVADDPSCWSSAQSEQDSRGYAYISKIPVLEPASPQDCYDFTKLAYEISERFNLPVILRTTTRVNHQRAIVEFNEIALPPSAPRNDVKLFEKNPHQFSTMPPRVLEQKKELLEKLKKLQKFLEASKANKVSGKAGKLGIIASGVSYFHTLEALEELKLSLPVLKLGSFYPLPEKKISGFLKGLKKVLVAEETDPFLEKEIIRIAKTANYKAEVFGKDVLGEIGELNPEKVLAAVANILKIKTFRNSLKIKNLKLEISRRTAKLCAGCPYWQVFPVLKRIAPDAIYGGDIGCNMIGGIPPHSLHDYLFDMGASIGISHGVSKALSRGIGETEQKIISLMGDGTFFHSGIAPLINAVYNKSNQLVIILDNRITAMTGHQQNPGMGKTATGQDAEELKIEEIAKACGVKHIKVLDQINIKELEESVKEFMQKKEVSMIICRKMCALLVKRLDTNTRIINTNDTNKNRTNLS